MMTSWANCIPSRVRLATSLAILETGCILVDWRFSRSWPVSHLYYLPVALGGALSGFGVAIPLALISAVAFITLNFAHLTHSATEADLLRLLLFLAVGVVASTLRRTILTTQRTAEALKEANAKLGQACAQLREQQDLRVQQVAQVAHDVMQPLTSMKAEVDILLRHNPSALPAYQRQLASVSANCRRTANLLANLIEAARIEGRGLELKLSDVDVVAGVQEALQAFGTAVEHELVVESQGFVPLISADRTLLVRVFMNLIGNAIKYSPPGTQVLTTIRCEPPNVNIRIRDEGIGIPEPQMARALEPFVQIPRAERKQGYGLGLAIAHEIVTRHGGDMFIESQVGNGTTIRIKLPIAGPGPARNGDHSRQVPFDGSMALA